MIRCVNLDWLECYVLEDCDNYPHDVNKFSELGYRVIDRGYGTRSYREMFTILDDDGFPLYEIRRLPVGAFKDGEKCILEPYSCHIRFVNRQCYAKDAIKRLQEFLALHRYSFQRISRVDICLDFEKFDSGDDPQRFIDRYLAGKYAKINQANLRANGKDMWDGVRWNSLSWGSPCSFVTTKLYNKTLELAEVKDKPYIRQSWFAHGLVDNFMDMTKTRDDGTKYKPTIWRLEFTLKSAVRKWFTMENNHGGKNKKISIENNLDRYCTKEGMLQIFASVQHHYFFFRYYQEGKTKYECEEKKLFNFNSEVNTFYDIEKPMTSKPIDKTIDALERRLNAYRMTHFDQDLRTAIDTILHYIQKERAKLHYASPADNNERKLLQRLLAWRLKEATNSPLEHTLNEIRALMDLPDEIF